MNVTTWLWHYFTIISGHLFANCTIIFHKTEDQAVILTFLTIQNLIWIKATT